MKAAISSMSAMNGSLLGGKKDFGMTKTQTIQSAAKEITVFCIVTLHNYINLILKVCFCYSTFLYNVRIAFWWSLRFSSFWSTELWIMPFSQSFEFPGAMLSRMRLSHVPRPKLSPSEGNLLAAAIFSLPAFSPLFQIHLKLEPSFYSFW